MLVQTIPSYYSDRRDRLMALYPEYAFVLPAHPEYIRNGDVHHSYRQSSHFYYLTGFDESRSCAIVLPGSQSKGHRLIMFIQDRDFKNELWTGERYGFDRVRSIFGADEVYAYSELKDRLPDLLSGLAVLAYQVGFNSKMDALMFDVLAQVRRKGGRTGRGLLPIYDIEPLIGEMRLFKSGQEIHLLKQAAEFTAMAHKRLMGLVRAGQNEREVEALFEFEVKRLGCQRLGYPTIVAAGKNATCLHYTRNNDVLHDGELLLVDAGGEYDYYCADITRSFPIASNFTGPQRDVYALVLAAQQVALQLVKPGQTMEAIHLAASQVLAQGLIDLNVLSGSLDDVLATKSYQNFYPHLTGHWLGMDVHDCGLYQQKNGLRRLEPGMVFTVEPGLYFQQDGLYPDHYRGIGVRIEDNVVVTDKGADVLTSGVPKTISDIETLRSQALL